MGEEEKRKRRIRIRRREYLSEVIDEANEGVVELGWEEFNRVVDCLGEGRHEERGKRGDNEKIEGKEGRRGGRGGKWREEKGREKGRNHDSRNFFCKIRSDGRNADSFREDGQVDEFSL